MKAMFRFWAVALGLAALGADEVKAQTVGSVSNTEETTIAGWAVSKSLWLGAAFETGSETSQLDSITLVLGAGELTPNQPMVLSLYGATTGGHVGEDTGVVFQANRSATDNSSGDVVWTPLTAFQLRASTRYWVTFTSLVENGSDFNWSYTDSTQYVSEGGWSLVTGSYALSTNQGSTWSEDSGLTPKLSVSASAVPEPGVIELVAVGLLGTVALRVWRRKA